MKDSLIIHFVDKSLEVNKKHLYNFDFFKVYIERWDTNGEIDLKDTKFESADFARMISTYYLNVKVIKLLSFFQPTIYKLVEYKKTLYELVYSNDFNSIVWLLDKTGYPDDINLFVIAVQLRNRRLLRFLIKKFPNFINQPDNGSFYTPLLWAYYLGFDDIYNILSDAGGHLGLIGFSHKLIGEAILKNHEKIVEYLHKIYYYNKRKDIIVKEVIFDNHDKCSKEAILLCAKYYSPYYGFSETQIKYYKNKFDIDISVLFNTK